MDILDSSKVKDDIWTIVKKELKNDKDINANIYNLYISKSKLYKRLDHNLIISTNSKISEKIISAISPKIISIIKKKFNLALNIEYKFLSKNLIEDNIESNQFTINNGNRFDKNFKFKNFVKGSSNEEAFLAAKEVSKSPGIKWNPLFIYGDSGLGKTHLLYSIKNELIKKKYKAKYITSEEFGKLSIDNMSKGHHEIENFKKTLKVNNILLIDDIQLLAKRNKTNEIFFYIINHFIENNKQIVLTSDKLPEELGGFEDRLISRFAYGLSIKMKKPDYNTALEIVKMKLKLKNNHENFSQEAIEFIAKNFSFDVRQLEGSINRMVFYSILNKKDKNDFITIKDIQEAFKDKKFKITNKKITIKNIKEIVAEEYNISLKILCGKSRISNIMIARQLAMYLSRQITKLPLSTISMEFNRKDHTTVINAIKRVEQKIKIDKKFKDYVKKIQKKLMG